MRRSEQDVEQVSKITDSAETRWSQLSDEIKIHAALLVRYFGRQAP
jgi:hypothetical protein